MTFDSLEVSLASGEPIELYEFSYGTAFWRYTSSAFDKLLENITWSAESMERTEISQNTEVIKSSLKITVPRNNQVADLFRVQPPTNVVTVKIFQYHEDDGVKIVAWIGRVLNVEWRDEQAVLTCDPAYAALQRPGLRRCWQLGCPHALFGNMCKVLKLDYQTASNVTSVTGATIKATEAASKPDDYFDGGFIEYENLGNVVEVREITSHKAMTLNLDVALPSLLPGAKIFIYPGCKHNMDDCSTKFSNLLNYGGVPYLPQLNPYAGDPVY